MAEPIEQNELDSTRRALFIETERTEKIIAMPSRRHRCRQSRALDQSLHTRRLVGGETGVFAGEPRRRDHPDRDRLAVKIISIAGARFDRVSDSVSEIQRFAQPPFTFIGLPLASK